MLSRQPSGSSTVIDLTSDTDSDDEFLHPNALLQVLSGTSKTYGTLSQTSSASVVNASRMSSQASTRVNSNLTAPRMSRASSLLDLLESDRANGGSHASSGNSPSPPVASSTGNTPITKKRTITQISLSESDTETEADEPAPATKKQKSTTRSATNVAAAKGKGKTVSRTASTTGVSAQKYSFFIYWSYLIVMRPANESPREGRETYRKG